MHEQLHLQSDPEENPLPRWIPISLAIEIDGSPSPVAFAAWVKRWNWSFATQNKVKRRYGKVELNSLLAAIAEDEIAEGYEQLVVRKAYTLNNTTPIPRRHRIKAF